ncbi:hypothetical protein D3C81_1839890 [compost metagenome]
MRQSSIEGHGAEDRHVGSCLRHYDLTPETSLPAQALGRGKASQLQAQGALFDAVIGSDTQGPVTRHDLWMGVTESIMPPTGNQHAPGSCCLEKAPGRRTATAMMRRLQPIHAGVLGCLQPGLLAAGIDIPGQ